jgi:hypothetical protein
MEKEKKSSVNKLLLVLLLLSIGFNIYQVSDKREVVEQNAVQVDSLLSAGADVEKELNDTYNELNQYKGINARLDSLLAEANAEVDVQRSKMEQLMKKERNEAVRNEKMLVELQQLKKIKDDYLEKIDSLLVENEKLKKEKDDLSTTVASLTHNLENTVNTASVLKSEYFTVTPFRKKSSGKYQATALAKRTQKLESCFTLLENGIAHSGERTVYLRIVEPGGKVLSNASGGSGTFKKPGTEEELLYTSSRLIEYKNEKLTVCLAWEDLNAKLPSGTYLMEIYVDGMFSGASSVNLQ